MKLDFKEDMEREVKAARADRQKLDQFIDRSRRFILFQAFRTTHRFVSTSDDEWSVALIAFSEAIDTWVEDKGPFRPFAALVIRRRLMDHMGSQARHAQEISVEPYSFEGQIDEDEDGVNAEVRRSAYEFVGYADEASTPGSSGASDEIAAMQQLLSPYGFSFFDLTESSPKADKTKRKCAEAIAAMVNSDRLFAQMRKDRSLPQKQLSQESGVERKILERHRRFIIAGAEILRGDYPILSSYLGYVRKEGEKVKVSA